MRGISGDDPEGGARRGVPRRRLITARPGRHGTPTARHYDLAARSSLYGSGGNAGEGSVGPEPKIATVERREAGGPALWDARGLDRCLASRVTCRPNGCLASIRTSLGAPPPLNPGERSERSKPRAQKTRRGNEEVLCDEKSFSSSFRPSRDSGESRN